MDFTGAPAEIHPVELALEDQIDADPEGQREQMRHSRRRRKSLLAPLCAGSSMSAPLTMTKTGTHHRQAQLIRLAAHQAAGCQPVPEALASPYPWRG